MVKLIRIPSIYLALLACLLGFCAAPFQLQEKSERLNIESLPDYSIAPRLSWTNRLSAPVRQALWVDSNRLIVATYRGDLYLLSLETGKRVSRYWIPYRRPVQVLYCEENHRRLLVAGIGETKVYAYDLRRGKVTGSWRFPGLDGSIVARQGYYYGIRDSRELLQIDSSSFTIKRRQTLPARCSGGIFALEPDQISLITEDGIYRWFASDLVPLGQTPLGLNPKPVLQNNHDTLLIADSKGRVVALYQQKVIFSKDLGKPIFSSPIMRGSVLYCAAADGEVVAIDTKEDRRLWIYQGEGLINLPLAFLGEHLVVPFAQGKIRIVDTIKGELLYELDGKGLLKLVLVGKSAIIAFRQDRKVIAWQW